jgi:hypothetical protein
MSEWWTYSLSDLLMFSARTYYRLFELYNLAIWPGQLLAGAGALVILACVLRGGGAAGRTAAVLLAACWLWVRWAFLCQRYAPSTVSGGFAIGFAVAALLLLWIGCVRGRMRLAPGRAGAGRAALGVLLFAMLGYPLVALASGRAWRQMELFGVAPDPTALATLALLVSTARSAWPLLPIPLLWCAIGGATLWAMRAPEAGVSPLGVLVLCAIRRRRCCTEVSEIGLCST